MIKVRICALFWASLTIVSPKANGETLLETVQRLSADVERLKTQCASQSVFFGPGYASFNNDQGKQTAFIGQSFSASTGRGVAQAPTGRGYIQLNNIDGAARVMASTAEVGGYARFYNNKGDEIVYIGGLTNGKGTVEINGERLADFAEVFELATRTSVIPGTVMSATSAGGELTPSTAAYDRSVVGVISGAGDLQAGLRIGSRSDGSKDLPVALIGQVYVRISTENGPIQAGDLLVSSTKPGVAMRASDDAGTFGAVIGKALEPYTNTTDNEGLVKMLVMNR